MCLCVCLLICRSVCLSVYLSYLPAFLSFYLVVIFVAAVTAVLQLPHAEDDVDVVEQALGAIRSLSFDSVANIRALTEAGACAGAFSFVNGI